MPAPFTRGALFVNQADLIRATQRQDFASEQAKQMMGAGNPLIGKDKRAGASTPCPSCGRWHRPGNLCPNLRRSLGPVPGDSLSPADSYQAELDKLHQVIADETPREPASNISVTRTLLGETPEPPKAETHLDKRKKFQDGSEHIKTQTNDYLSALRKWQSKYVGQ